TEASGVVADELDVEQLKAALAQVFDQADQRHLRGIAPAREHRLAGEQAADRDTVDAASQFVSGPHFEAVGVTAGVEFLVGPDQRRGDPAAVAWPVGTAADDLAEGAIDGMTKAARAKRAQEPPRDVQLGQFEDAARVGRPPQERVFRSEPGEDAAAIGFQQALGAQVSAHGNQADLVGILGIEAWTSGHETRSGAAQGGGAGRKGLPVRCLYCTAPEKVAQGKKDSARRRLRGGSILLPPPARGRELEPRTAISPQALAGVTSIRY